MQEQLSQPAQGAKILARDLARAKQQREATAPEYLKVQRRELTHPQLNAACALVLAAMRWLTEGGKEISDRLIASWLGVHESTVYRARQRIAAVTEPYPETPGYLEVDLEALRDCVRRARANHEGGGHGMLEACAMAQLKGWCNPEHGSARFRGRNFVVPARELGQRLGCCAKTALSLLRRLAGTFVEVCWEWGFAAGVRLLGPREKPSAAPPPSKAAPAPTAPVLAAPIADRTADDKRAEWLAKLAELDAKHGPAPA